MFLIKRILFLILRFLSWSYRFKVLGFENCEKAQSSHPLKSYLLVFWHEHLLSPLFYFRGTPFSVVISDSRDGHLIAYQCEKFGYGVVHGSQNRDGKDKGGLRALIGMFAFLKKGIPVALTVDGSIGPRRHVKSGVIDLARKSKSAILPVASVASSYWTLNTWDQFKIPKPFSTVVVQFGEPILVDSNLNKEEMPKIQDQIAEAINLQEKKAVEYLKSLKSQS